MQDSKSLRVRPEFLGSYILRRVVLVAVLVLHVLVYVATRAARRRLRRHAPARVGASVARGSAALVVVEQLASNATTARYNTDDTAAEGTLIMVRVDLRLAVAQWPAATFFGCEGVCLTR